MTSLSRSVLINTLWSFVGRFGYLAVGLASNIFLARLLGPTEFGQVAIVMFFIAIGSVLIESGLSGALIRKQDAREVDYSTIFIFNLVVSLCLMVALIAAAGFIASFYKDPSLKNILVVSSVVFLINALRIVQTAKIIKNMQFKLKAGCEFVAILVASIVAIALAYSGAGVWSLVVLQVATSIMLTLLLWVAVGALKSYKFSKDAFLLFYKFGANTTLASLLNAAFDNIYQLVLARYFLIQQSGYFYQAKKLQEMPVGVLQTMMSGVIYSALAKLQDVSDEFDALYLNATKFFTIIVAAICMITYFCSDAFIFILYGEEWLPAAMYLKFLAVASFFYLQEMFNRVIFKVFDRTGLILQLEIVKKAIQACTIFYGVWIMSVQALLIGFVVTNVMSFLIGYYVARRVQGRFCWGDFVGVLKIFFSAVLAVIGCELMINLLDIGMWGRLLISVLMVAIFVVLLHLLKTVHLVNDWRRLVSILRG